MYLQKRLSLLCEAGVLYILKRARASTAKTSNTVSSAPYHTIPQREPSVWTYANAHYSGDKETVEHAAEALREIQQREKENQEAYNPLQTFSAVLDFLPFIGNAKAGQEASTGVDLITGQELDEWDRGIAAASIFLGGIGKVGGRALKNIAKGSDNFTGATRIGDSQATGGTTNNLNKGIGKGEQVLDKVKTYEQARNKALDLVGDLGPNSQPYTGTLKSSAGYGQIVGRRSADGKVRWRLDYDPDKGTHINVEAFRNGKGANARKIAIPFEGNESTFKSLLKHLNR